MATVTEIVRALDVGRRWTNRLLDPLDDDALSRQYDPIMSPLAWDLGHIGNYEELWLLRALGNREFADPRMDRIYDAFDNPRWTRADLPLLPRDEAHEYLADVRAAAMRTLRATGLDPDEPLLRDGFVYALVEQHEAQHQETMLQALNLAVAATPYRLARRPAVAVGRRVDDSERVVVPAGPFAMGSDSPHVYDNERPRHTLDVAAFAIDRYPVTARRYAAFIAAGGYHNPAWWSDRGWAWRQEAGHDAPQGWEPHAGGWRLQHLGHVRPVDPREPVVHVSYWEAEAFAAWSGGRLPTEAEWEKAATFDPAAGASRPYPWGRARPTPQRANLDRSGWGPLPVGSLPAGASPLGVDQLLGDCYEWTSSDFLPYPGYQTFPYPEYSEVFFGGDYKVLRGASWATRPSVARTTFRNWDHPHRRQIFAGVRLAWDL
jgi:gamma-glutamyl hercynylcysteine S-oxide synthase